MTVEEVIQLIQEIRDESSRAEKLRLLGILAGSDFGRWVLKWTYDPQITFGIRPGRTENQTGRGVSLRPSLVEGLFYRLARRELTGRSAEAEVAGIMMEMKPSSGELLYMILNRDLKMGIAANTISKAVPDLIQVMRVMRAETYKSGRLKSWPAAIEPKLDGHRSSFIVRNGAAGFYTRTGHRVDALEHLVDPLMELFEERFATKLGAIEPLRDLIGGITRSEFNFVIDGEAMVDGNFNELTGALRSSEAADGYVSVYDLLALDEFESLDPSPRNYLVRRASVERLISVVQSPTLRLTPRYLVRNEEEAMVYYQRFLEDGYEGAMVKSLDGLYHKRKHGDWQKLKPEDKEDLQIIGFFNGDRDSQFKETTGGVIVDRAGVEVRVSGIKNEVRAEIHKLWLEDAALMGWPEAPGFKGFIVPPEQRSAPGLQLIGRLTEVEYNVVTVDGSLRHPRLGKFRDDKTEPTVLEAAE